MLMGMPRRARVLYLGTVALAGGCLIASAASSRNAAPRTIEEAGFAILVVALCLVFHLYPFTTIWRGHRLAIHPDEAVLLLGFVVLPPTLVVDLSLVAALAGQLVQRKPFVKALFNVSGQLVATTAGAIAFLSVRATGVPPLGSALIVPPVVSLVNQGIVALFLTALARRPLREAWTGSLLATVGIASLTGMLAGVIVISLYDLAPAAILLAGPLWFVVNRAMANAIHRENELSTRRALNALSERLPDARSDAEILELALDACEQAFAPPAMGASLRGEEVARGRPADHPRVSAPLLVGDAAQGEIWIALATRRRSEHEPFHTLLVLVASYASVALARLANAREIEAHREALARAERLSALGTLVAGIAHEVNNPLMYMGSSLDLLEIDLEEGDEEDAKAHVERVRAGVERIRRVTKALALVARQQRAPTKQRVRGGDVMDEVETLVRAGLPEHVRLAFATPRGLCVDGSATDLAHCVLGVVRNAIEALPPEGGKVDVSCFEADGDVVIRVEDDGAGMSEEAKRNAFVPFFTTKPDGIGLGLAGVLGIVTAHGGTVRLDSEEGRGTRVELRLPGSPSAATVPRAGAPGAA